jgi:hypothetical protein
MNHKYKLFDKVLNIFYAEQVEVILPVAVLKKNPLPNWVGTGFAPFERGILMRVKLADTVNL